MRSFPPRALNFARSGLTAWISFPWQKCAFDVLFEVEGAPVPGGVLIGDVSEHVNVHAAGFARAGRDAPAEFPTKGKPRVKEFAGGFLYVCVGGVDRFQLLRREATCGFGAVALEGAGIEAAIAGVFEQAIFDAVVGVAFVQNCVVEEFQFFGRHSCCGDLSAVINRRMRQAQR